MPPDQSVNVSLCPLSPTLWRLWKSFCRSHDEASSWPNLHWLASRLTKLVVASDLMLLLASTSISSNRLAFFQVCVLKRRRRVWFMKALRVFWAFWIQMLSLSLHQTHPSLPPRTRCSRHLGLWVASPPPKKSLQTLMFSFLTFATLWSRWWQNWRRLFGDWLGWVMTTLLAPQCCLHSFSFFSLAVCINLPVGPHLLSLSPLVWKKKSISYNRFTTWLSICITFPQ